MTTYEGGNLAGLQQKLTEFSTAVNPPLAPEGNSLSFSLALHPSLSTFSSSISYFSSPAPVGGPRHSLTLLLAPLPHFLFFLLSLATILIFLFFLVLFRFISDQAQITALLSVLKDTAKYHSTRVTEDQIRVIIKKLLVWPSANLLPVLDLIRLLFTHTHAAEIFGSVVSFWHPVSFPLPPPAFFFWCTKRELHPLSMKSCTILPLMLQLQQIPCSLWDVSQICSRYSHFLLHLALLLSPFYRSIIFSFILYSLITVSRYQAHASW